jgi:hypothetical protein
LARPSGSRPTEGQAHAAAAPRPRGGVRDHDSLIDIANEEKEHAGEFLSLLRELDPDEEKFYRGSLQIPGSERRKHVGGRRTTRDERDTLFVRKPSYLAVAHVDLLGVDGVRASMDEEAFTGYPRSALSLHHVSRFTVRDVARRPPGGSAGPAVILVEDYRHGLLADCVVRDGGAPLAEVVGDSGGIRVDAGDE